MYHGLDPGDGRYAACEAGVMPYVLSREAFRSHLQVLGEMGRRVVRPEDFLANLGSCGSRPALPSSSCCSDGLFPPGEVLLTFDDGMASDYDVALPELASAGCRALFFVVTGKVGERGRVSRAQLREMVAAGMSLGAHGHTHRYLTTLSAREQRNELESSRKWLEDQVGVSVAALSLPGGRFNSHTLAAARDRRFETVFTSAPFPPRYREEEKIWTVGRVAVRTAWFGSLLVGFLGRQDKHLRRMRRADAARRLAREFLGDGLYSRLHRLFWRLRGH